MDFICGQLGIQHKTKHAGFSLWQGCEANDPAAWKTMEKYNRNDVSMLEQLYIKLLPWIKSHPNRSVYSGKFCCPNCGGKRLHHRGTAVSLTSRYERMQCSDCGKWSRGNIVLTRPANEAIVKDL
jgi:predicted RNA-binding Zn-ribbon protein involved in translation (DUF1610 family)